jgi:hypothetical protein
LLLIHLVLSLFRSSYNFLNKSAFASLCLQVDLYFKKLILFWCPEIAINMGFASFIIVWTKLPLKSASHQFMFLIKLFVLYVLFWVVYFALSHNVYFAISQTFWYTSLILSTDFIGNYFQLSITWGAIIGLWLVFFCFLLYYLNIKLPLYRTFSLLIFIKSCPLDLTTNKIHLRALLCASLVKSVVLMVSNSSKIVFV